MQANISFPVFYLKTVVMWLLGLSSFVPILWPHHAFWVRLGHPQGMAPARSPWESIDASSSFSPSFCFWVAICIFEAGLPIASASFRLSLGHQPHKSLSQSGTVKWAQENSGLVNCKISLEG